MIGLVDCNNFFASCERVFNPSLNGKPIVVLSNNDGCVVARSNEIKSLGIKMGVPVYQIKEEIKRYGIHVFSSNYSLYGDMSNRVMTTLASLSPGIDVYSIDEAFVDVEGIQDLHTFATDLVRKTSRGTGIPVSFGAAPTRTLAKLANRFSKKHKGYNRVCIIDTDDKRIKALQLTDVGDIWGIGRQSTKKLQYHGVNTAYDLTLKSRSWVRKMLAVVGEKTWLELNSTPYTESDTIESKQQICTSRSFGQMVTTFNDLRESVAYFATRGCEKLRGQKSLACGVIVFVYTNRFKEDLSQYFPTKYTRLPFATSDTTEIVGHCIDALHSIYQEGYQYKKAGVILTDIIDSEYRILDLFDIKDRVKQKDLAKAMDAINRKFGQDTLKLGINTKKGDWALKREYLSKNPSTNLNDVIEIRV